MDLRQFVIWRVDLRQFAVTSYAEKWRKSTSSYTTGTFEILFKALGKALSHAQMILSLLMKLYLANQEINLI